MERAPAGRGGGEAPDDLETVVLAARAAGVQLTANRSMLQLLDLPALLVVRLPGTPEQRWWPSAGSTSPRHGGRGRRPRHRRHRHAGGVLGGQAHVLWRDFDGLGPGLQAGARGPAVAQLQGLLRRAGIVDFEPTGTFDAGTARAVVDFQRRHRLDADGVVGPLTRIVLYGAAADRRRPGLAIALDHS